MPGSYFLKLFSICLSAGFAMTFFGCATILSGSTQNIEVQSEPPGAVAEFRDSNNRTLGSCTTPGIAKVTKGSSCKLVVSKAGYLSDTRSIDAQTDMYFWWNCAWAYLAPIGMLIDWMSGNHNKYSSSFIYVNLRPEQTAESKPAAATSKPRKVVALDSNGCAMVDQLSIQVKGSLLKALPKDSLVAVLDFNFEGKPKCHPVELASVVTEFVRAGLIAKSSLMVVDRRNQEQIIAEHAFQTSDCVSTECRVRFGQILGVQYLIDGELREVGDWLLISLFALNVETGAIEAQVTVLCQCEASMMDEVIEQILKGEGN